MRTSFVDMKKRLPVLGVGLGYRTAMAEQTIAHRDQIDFLEVVSENYLTVGSRKMAELEDAHAFQIIPHGVELSIGSVDAIDSNYLALMKRFLKQVNAPWWSDHLSFTGADGSHLNSLIPMPFSREAVDHVVNRVKTVQQQIEVPFLLENITYYLKTPGSDLTEVQFISEVVEKADCGLLLDVNNVYVNSQNFNYDPFEFINQLPLERVVQIHIAGHRKQDDVVLDTHGAKISKPVYDLLAHVLRMTSVNAILLERDQYFPRFNSLLKELSTIRQVAAEAQPRLVLPGNSLVDLQVA